MCRESRTDEPAAAASPRSTRSLTKEQDWTETRRGASQEVIDQTQADAVFMRYLDALPEAPEPAAPDETLRAQQHAAASAASQIVTAGDDETMSAALAQLTQVSRNLDMQAMLNAVHVPEDAEEHADMLRRLLARIPDGWGRWIGCGPGWYGLLAEAERELTALCPTFTVEQIKEKFGTLRLYVTFDHDDDLPADLRAAEPHCPTQAELARELDVKDPGWMARDTLLAAAWRDSYERMFLPAKQQWDGRAKAFRDCDEGRVAAADQQRRAAAFHSLVEQYERRSATICDRCGTPGQLGGEKWLSTRCAACR